MAVDDSSHGWWWPIPSGSAHVRAHYVLPDGWSLCGRWRRKDDDQQTIGGFAWPERSLCKECVVRWQHRGKKSKLAIALRRSAAEPRGAGFDRPRRSS